MDIEAIQLLNLSPIPELSERELSTVMDQLSGISDINGDITDQNVEDILREAEDLIGKSSNHKISELKSVKKITELEGNESFIQDSNDMKGTEKRNIQELPLDDCKHFNAPIKNDYLVNEVNDEDEIHKHFNSPEEQTPVKTFSPGGSCNHIKSTIDSLKEFSIMIEKQLSNRSQNLSPKYNKIYKENERGIQDKDVIVDSHSNENSGINKTSHLIMKKNLAEPLDKSEKLLNCFERLYQNKPVRLTMCKKPKTTDKVPKTLVKKKLAKDLKNTIKNNKQGKNFKIKGGDTLNTINEKIYQNLSHSAFTNSDLLDSTKTPEYSSHNKCKYLSNLKVTECQTSKDQFLKCLKHQLIDRNNRNYDSNLILSKTDEQLILKVLEEMEDTQEIKDQVTKVGTFSNGLSPEVTAEDQAVIDSLKSEVESVREKVTSVSNAGIKRLQEQFALLKVKYYQQMDKLEAENLKLKEALHCHQKFFAAQKNNTNMQLTVPEISFITETKIHKSSIPSFKSSCESDKNVTENFSENCTEPSARSIPPSLLSKEVFCQTEKEVNSVSVQCTPDVTEEEKKEVSSETKKADNKENVTLRHKFKRSKPFSDVGIHQLTRQKKLLDHESQLLATLRGLQSEMSTKDKENRKLKTEIELLKKQIKKFGSNRMENCKKSHTGTQTIGLGPSVQKAYIPEMFEVPKEFKKENEELKSRIKALEEDFELLKEKRINDLQSLHQVHEEEMAKLVSKLETQSSLTKHLHSLLVNR